MATSGDRKRVFASSKFSRSTRETYSGSKAIRAPGGRALSGPPDSGLSPQPHVEHAPLRLCGRRVHLELPAFGGFGAKREGDAHELLTPRDEERDLIAGLVLLEPVVQPIGAH